MSLQKTAIITGATGDIGRALCQSFHDDGVRVIGLSHDDDMCAPWVHHKCDFSNITALENVLKDIYQSEKYPPDVLINNAGVYLAKPWDELSSTEFSDTMQINTTAPFVLTKFWAQKLIDENKAGVCVNVSSISALMGSVDVSYAASKAGLVMVTKTMAKVLAKNNIRINAIASGPVQSKMANSIPQDRQEKYKESIPMGRFAKVNEIVSLIKSLVSESSSYMTGSIVSIDGGLT